MSELTSPGPKSEITYEIAYTKNMGNYESLRINVGLSTEFVGGSAEADKVLAKVRAWTEDRLGTAINEVSAELTTPKE